jgi:DNA adenine methylase
MIRERPAELASLIEMTPWAREEYSNSYFLSGESLEDARRFLVRMWQAFGAKSSGTTGWRNNIKGNNGNVTQFSTRLPNNLIDICNRLKHIPGCTVQIDCQDAIKLIERHNRENVLMYIDPPYLRSTRSGTMYKCEYKEDDHLNLLQSLFESKAKIIISGYDNQLYNDVLGDWRKEEKKTQTELGKERTEMLWINYLEDEIYSIEETQKKEA